jgi:hypothetical protein
MDMGGKEGKIKVGVPPIKKILKRGTERKQYKNCLDKYNYYGY